jgi:hypothetical protein
MEERRVRYSAWVVPIRRADIEQEKDSVDRSVVLDFQIHKG